MFQMILVLSNLDVPDGVKTSWGRLKLVHKFCVFVSFAQYFPTVNFFDAV